MLIPLGLQRQNCPFSFLLYPLFIQVLINMASLRIYFPGVLAGDPSRINVSLCVYVLYHIVQIVVFLSYIISCGFLSILQDSFENVMKAMTSLLRKLSIVNTYRIYMWIPRLRIPILDWEVVQINSISSFFLYNTMFCTSRYSKIIVSSR
jgi:hypothetical protein